ncbi:hypothetical protein [Oscillatoria acuminata]|uniref:Uncharacterized protein n=1 Tax=Oscillatoria acuminata PCC 6304 TaxID=56110 RepID=K9TQU4_9CYAN|nr:hypothetical protein [Oscillatoria acuminata]AFY84925.1 hypothetical protein Oscil6304_5439 [Oscillatoria acuminata PCC 6304]
MSEPQPLNPEYPSFDPLQVRQTILKLLPPKTGPVAGEFCLDREAIAAWEKLIAKVAEMRLPKPGGIFDYPPTPEILTPYLLPEACQVLDSFKQAAVLPPELNPDLNPAPNTAPEPLFIPLEDWIPELLWYAVSSSEAVMRLISGIPAHIFQPEQGWDGGMVRLVLGLRGKSGDCHWFFDLASDRPCPYPGELVPLDPETTRIQSDAVASLRESLPLGNFLSQLRQQLHLATPELARFLQPTPVEFLQPGSPWQVGQIELTLEFEFVRDPELEFFSGPFSDPDHPTSAKIRPCQPLVDYPDSSTTPGTCDGGIAAAVLPLLWEWQEKSDGIPESNNKGEGLELIPLFVAIASRLLDTEPSDPVTPSPTLEISIDELASQLLWKMLGSGLEAMQWIAGVHARILQPEREWETGMVRLVGLLTVETPRFSCSIDIATGQPPSPIAPLASGTVILSARSGWYSEATALEQLSARFWAGFSGVSVPPTAGKMAGDPVETLVAALLAGEDTIGVEICSSQQYWQSGWAQLGLAIEFIPS